MLIQSLRQIHINCHNPASTIDLSIAIVIHKGWIHKLHASTTKDGPSSAIFPIRLFHGHSHRSNHSSRSGMMLIVMSGFNDTHRVRPWGAARGLCLVLIQYPSKKKQLLATPRHPQLDVFHPPGSNASVVHIRGIIPCTFHKRRHDLKGI
jgi:hypothetical protein